MGKKKISRFRSLGPLNQIDFKVLIFGGRYNSFSIAVPRMVNIPPTAMTHGKVLNGRSQRVRKKKKPPRPWESCTCEFATLKLNLRGFSGNGNSFLLTPTGMGDVGEWNTIWGARRGSMISPFGGGGELFRRTKKNNNYIFVRCFLYPDFSKARSIPEEMEFSMGGIMGLYFLFDFIPLFFRFKGFYWGEDSELSSLKKLEEYSRHISGGNLVVLFLIFLSGHTNNF